MIALVGLSLTNRAAFETANGFGAFCRPTPGATPLQVDQEIEVSLVSTLDNARALFCSRTGVQLEAGGRYELMAAVNATDGGIPVASPAGFSFRSKTLTARQRAVFAVFGPFRRLWSADW